jgi:hypothetical protein
MNKLRNLILGILLFNSSLVFGQTKNFNIGIEGGPSLISLYGNDMVKSYNELSLGFSGGLSFQYNFSKLVALRTNLSFERKGLTSKIQETDEYGNPIEELTFHSNFNYLTLPLLGRLDFGKRINFYVNVGPYLGYLLSSREITEASGDFPKSEIDDTDDYKKLDFGITSGLGIIFPIQEKLLLSVEIRNNLGLTNISLLPVFNDGSIKTNSTNLLIGISYGIGNQPE